jgi:hypothetical protein
MTILANIRNAAFTIWDVYEKERFEKAAWTYLRILITFSLRLVNKLNPVKTLESQALDDFGSWLFIKLGHTRRVHYRLSRSHSGPEALYLKRPFSSSQNTCFKMEKTLRLP